MSIYELKCPTLCSEMICNLIANRTHCIGARSKKCPSVMSGGIVMIKTYIFLVFALLSLTKHRKIYVIQRRVIRFLGCRKSIIYHFHTNTTKIACDTFLTFRWRTETLLSGHDLGSLRVPLYIYWICLLGIPIPKNGNMWTSLLQVKLI